ncbi:MAG: hypothetical protein NT062_21690 [Proteobacteria bacterium]|nr:hypothetical protein [Pseudomonadota bacterium]
MSARSTGWLTLLLLGDVGCDAAFGLDELPSIPRFASVASTHAMSVDSLAYPLEVAAGEDRALLVAVQLSALCSTPDTGVVLSVTYGDASLTPITSITGTPCNASATRSELWLLRAPAIGQADVIVTLSARSIVHSGAIALAGIAHDDPVRAFTVASGQGTMSMINVPSAAGDLVVNTVGHGTGISGVADGATLCFLDNASPNSTLDNTAGSAILSEGPSVTSTWSLAGDDQWQMISTSLRPAP